MTTAAIQVRKKWALVLVAFLAALGLTFGSAVEKAGATEVVPANSVGHAQLQADQLSWFIPNNAYYPLAVGCTASTADFQISPVGAFSYNQNKSNVGPLSNSPGGVIGNIIDGPDFNNCGVYGPFSVNPPDPPIKAGDPGTPVFDATVTTEDGWTVTGVNDDVNDPSVSIAVPPNGAEIRIHVPPLGDCVLDVAPAKAQAVFAYYENGNPTTPTPSTMHVDSQVLFSESPDSDFDCQSTLGFETSMGHKTDYAIAQFEALYDVTVQGAPAGTPVRILP